MIFGVNVHSRLSVRNFSGVNYFLTLIRLKPVYGLRFCSGRRRFDSHERPRLGDYRALLKTRGIQHVSLRVSGCRSDCVLAGGAVFCSRCEAENGDLQVRCGPTATARRGARCFPQEMHGGSGRSARPGACRSRHRAQAIARKHREKRAPIIGEWLQTEERFVA
jgi:hypothetical protein